MKDDIIEISFEDDYIKKEKPQIVITKDDLLRPAPPVLPLSSDDDPAEDVCHDVSGVPLLARCARNMLFQIIVACLFGGILACLLINYVE